MNLNKIVFIFSALWCCLLNANTFNKLNCIEHYRNVLTKDQNTQRAETVFQFPFPQVIKQVLDGYNQIVKNAGVVEITRDKNDTDLFIIQCKVNITNCLAHCQHHHKLFPREQAQNLNHNTHHLHAWYQIGEFRDNYTMCFVEGVGMAFNQCRDTIDMQFPGYTVANYSRHTTNATVMVLAESQDKLELFAVNKQHPDTTFQCYGGNSGRLLYYAKHYLKEQRERLWDSFKLYEPFLPLIPDFEQTRCAKNSLWSRFIIKHVSEIGNYTTDRGCELFGSGFRPPSKVKRSLFDFLFADYSQDIQSDQKAINTNIHNIKSIYNNQNSLFRNLEEIDMNLGEFHKHFVTNEQENHETTAHLHRTQVLRSFVTNLDLARMEKEIILRADIAVMTDKLKELQQLHHNLIRLLARGVPDCNSRTTDGVNCAEPPYLLNVLASNGNFEVKAKTAKYRLTKVRRFLCLPNSDNNIFKFNRQLFSEKIHGQTLHLHSINLSNPQQFPYSCPEQFSGNAFYCGGLLTQLTEANQPAERFGLYIVGYNDDTLYLTPKETQTTISYEDGRNRILKRGEKYLYTPANETIKIGQNVITFNSLQQAVTANDADSTLDLVIMKEEDAYRHQAPVWYTTGEESTPEKDWEKHFSSAAQMWENLSLFRHFTYVGSSIGGLMMIVMITCCSCWCLSRGWCCTCFESMVSSLQCCRKGARSEHHYQLVSPPLLLPKPTFPSAPKMTTEPVRNTTFLQIRHGAPVKQ